MRLLRPLAVIALTLGGLFATTGNASAAFTITISGDGLPGGLAGAPGYTSYTVTDGVSGVGTPGSGVEPDLIPATNVIGFNFADTGNNFVAKGTITLLQDSTSAILEMNNFTLTNSSGAAITNVTVTVQATGLTALGNLLSSSLAIGSGSPTGNYSLTTTLSNPNTPVAVTATGPTGVTPVTASTLVSPITGYTLTSVYTLDSLPDASGIKFSGSFGGITPTPAPATGLMALAGLPAIGLIRSLRRRNTQVAIA